MLPQTIAQLIAELGKWSECEVNVKWMWSKCECEVELEFELDVLESSLFLVDFYFVTAIFN